MPNPRFHGYFDAMGGQILLTNDFGRSLFLTPEEFSQATSGRALPVALRGRLEENLFLLGPENERAAAKAYRERTGFLAYGPALHIIVPTGRCNTTCVYCHSSRAPITAPDKEMSRETAKAAVDTIFEANNPTVTIEFQGGEPLLNWEICRYVIEYAREVNLRAGKLLTFSMVTNLSAMTEERARFLVAPDINLCTSVDGDALIHDQQRKLPGGRAHAHAVEWIRRINALYREGGYDPLFYRVQALLTTTRATLPRYREVVDHYLDLDMKVIHLRPLDPFGFAARTWEAIGYTTPEFLEYYVNTLEYLLELNRKGVEILEKTANILLMKIFNPTDPNFLDLRSPCGAGIGQVAYNYDGKVYPCDEGRMVREMGDDGFCLGEVGKDRLADLLSGETVRAMVISSCLDGLPGCSTCVYRPYCGVCPVYNYVTQGSLAGQPPTNERCKVLKGIFGYLFGKIQEGDPETIGILRRWGAVPRQEPQFCKSV